MKGVITRNVSIDDASTDRPVVNVQVRTGVCQPLEAFCREHGMTPVQFLPIDAGRWPGCFVGIFVPTAYARTS